MSTSLQDVDDDVLVYILSMLPLGDVLSVRQTSKRLQAVTHLRTVWYDQLRSEILSKGLPIPGTPVPLLEIPTIDLERRTRLAIQVEKMWTRRAGPRRPVLRQCIPAARQVALRIGGHELLTLHSDRVVTWRIEGANELATENIMHEHTLGTDNAWKIHKDPGGFGTIAVSSSSGEDVFIFSGAFNEPPLQRHYPGQVLGLFDQFVLTSASHESTSNINVYNWVDPSFGVATIHSHPSSFGNPITFAKFDSHLIVFWEACLTIHPMPTLPEAGQFSSLDPIQVFLFQSPIQPPVVFSPCVPSNLPGSALPSNSKYVKALSICYQTAGAWGVHSSILSRKPGGEDADALPFRLVRSHSIMGRDCARMRVGHSGRGLWWDPSIGAYRSNTVCMVTTEGGKYRALDMGQQSFLPLCRFPEILKDQYGDWALDFDEGMGRIVYCDEAGLVSIVDVV